MPDSGKSETKTITCIACPRGCAVTVEILGVGADGSPQLGEIWGNACPKGRDYGKQEMTNPLRTVTSTVRTVFPDFPRLPVRTAGDIPLADVFQAMEEINRVLVKERLHPGDVIQESIAGHPTALTATAEMALPSGVEKQEAENE